MSPTAKTYPVPSSKEEGQAGVMARNELASFLAQLTPGERIIVIRVARWWEKWQMVAGPRRMGRILLALARVTVNEVPYE